MQPQHKNRTQLFAHIFPCVDFDWDCFKFDEDKKILYIKHLFELHSSFNIPPSPKFWCFQTNGIFFNCCQKEVYNSTTHGIIEKLYHGMDSLVISYGQNYSGKSFTLSGLFNQFQLRGIIPRFVADLFEEQQIQLDDFTFEICISIVEIHGSLLYDLLSNPRGKCKTAKEVECVRINSVQQALKLLFKAETQRMTVKNASYNAHHASSIVTFIVTVMPLHAHDPVNKISKIHFVDLAGVETIERNPFTSFKEHRTQGIANVTKTLLEIFALRSNKSNNILKDESFPVNRRIHTITQFLGTSLNSSSNIRLICHIRPNMIDINITLSLLKFGMNFQNIPTRITEPHLEPNLEKTLENLQEQVKALQDELLMRNLWGERCPMIVSQNRVDFVRRAVKSFLKGDLTEYELISMVDDYSLILSIARNIHNDIRVGINVESASQTDEEFNDLFTQNKEENIEIHKRQSILKGSMTEENTSSSPERHVSFGKSRKGSRKTSGTKKGKNKTGKKSKEQDKIVLISEEIQVNLIEPLTKLPNIDSREGLWALFLINNPRIQERLDQFSVTVKEKDKKLNTEKIRHDDLSHSLDKTILDLNQLKSLRHVEGKETYDDEGKLVISEDESNLVKNLTQIKAQTEISKQKLTDAQMDWLESLEKLFIEKQQIEEEFKQFCVSRNLLELNIENTAKNLEQSEENFTIEIPEQNSTHLQELYEIFQKKYLRV